jgi:DNA polymerase III subunit delta
MKIAAEALESRLASAKSLNSIIWIAGNEPLLVIEAADAIRNAARRLGFSEKTIIHVDRYTKASDLIEAAGAMSLFAERRLIELRLPANKLNKDLGETLTQIAPTLGDDTVILLTSEQLDRTVTQSAWYSQLESLAWTVAIYPIKRNQLPAWLSDRLAKQGQHADKPLLEWLADKVEGNILAAQQEVRKLALLCPPGKLDTEQVQQAVLNVARFDAFSVVDSAIAGDLPRALRGLQGLQAEGEAPPIVVWAFADAARALVKLHDARQRGMRPSNLMASLRLFGPREQLFSQAVDRIPASACKAALDLTAAADRLTKGISDAPAVNRSVQTEPWEALAATARLLSGKSRAAHSAAGR